MYVRISHASLHISWAVQDSQELHPTINNNHARYSPFCCSRYFSPGIAWAEWIPRHHLEYVGVVLRTRMPSHISVLWYFLSLHMPFNSTNHFQQAWTKIVAHLSKFSYAFTPKLDSCDAAPGINVSTSSGLYPSAALGYAPYRFEGMQTIWATHNRISFSNDLFILIPDSSFSDFYTFVMCYILSCNFCCVLAPKFAQNPL